jgi:hypothetical protein
MKKIIIILTAVLATFSCSSIKQIAGKKFSYASPNRKLLLSFENDSLCSFKNIFYCDDIDSKYKEITIRASYKRQSNMIIIRNVTCKDNTCKFPSNIDIPIQESNKCVFLNKENRDSKMIFDGRKYQSDYHKYGLVPNIDIDTMYIYKNKITLIKEIGNGNLLFKGMLNRHFLLGAFYFRIKFECSNNLFNCCFFFIV